MNPESEEERRRAESPCIGVCVINEASGLCEGCLRTLEEIATWGSSNPAQRRQVLARIDTRRRMDAPRRAG